MKEQNPQEILEQKITFFLECVKCKAIIKGTSRASCLYNFSEHYKKCSDEKTKSKEVK